MSLENFLRGSLHPNKCVNIPNIQYDNNNNSLCGVYVREKKHTSKYVKRFRDNKCLMKCFRHVQIRTTDIKI